MSITTKKDLGQFGSEVFSLKENLETLTTVSHQWEKSYWFPEVYWLFEMFLYCLSFPINSVGFGVSMPTGT